MGGVGYTGICRTYLGTLRFIVGADAFGAPVGIDSMSSADGIIGATRPAIATVPGHSRALLGNDFISYLRRSFPNLYEKIVAFRYGNVNRGMGQNTKNKDRDDTSASRRGPTFSSGKAKLWLSFIAKFKKRSSRHRRQLGLVVQYNCHLSPGGK